MKRGVAFAVSAILSLFGGISFGQDYLIPGVPDGVTITIDGEADDWAWYPETYAITRANVQDDYGNPLPAADDWDIVEYMAWEAPNWLYMYCRITDDQFSVTSASNGEMWKDDCYRFTIDGDLSGGIFRTEESHGRTAQAYGVWIIDEPADPVRGMEGYSISSMWSEDELQWVCAPPYLDAAVDPPDGTMDVTYAYEMRVAVWDLLYPTEDESTPHVFSEGNQFGLTWMWSDTDATLEERDHNLCPIGGGDAWIDADRCAVFECVARIEIDPNRSILSDALVVPEGAEAGAPVTISATVTDPQGVSLVRAVIESPDETVVGSVDLTLEGESTYTGVWTTEATAKDYKLDFMIVDGSDITTTYDNRLSFTTIVQKYFPDYSIPGVPDGVTITIDGEADDWAWYPEAYAVTMESVQDNNGRPLPAADDWDIVEYVAWEAPNWLYMYCRITDDQFSVTSARNGEMWKDDCHEFTIDGDLSGGVYRTEESHGRTAQAYGVWIIDEPADPVRGMEGYSISSMFCEYELQWAAGPPYLEAAVKPPEGIYDVTYAYEVKVAVWDALYPSEGESTPHVFSEGNQFGLTWMWVDTDAMPETRDHNLSPIGGGDSWNDAGLCAVFECVASDPNRSVLWDVSAIPERPDPESSVTISATVTDSQGVSLVRAVIESPDETVAGSVDLTLEGESTYTGVWTTEATPKNYVVNFEIEDGSAPPDVTPYDSRLWFSTVNMPPVFSVEGSSVDPECCSPGDVVVIRAQVDDPDGDGVSSVVADIESPDENPVVTVALFDDGAHQDGVAGDQVYANTWVTGGVGMEYLVDIRATDGHPTDPARAEYDNELWFSTVNMPPVFSVEGSGVDPERCPPGNTVVIRAQVDDPDGDGVSSVYADIESPDENPVVTVALFDDGAHQDGIAGDQVYANTWVTGGVGMEYLVDIRTTDGHPTDPAESFHNNVLGFSTVALPGVQVSVSVAYGAPGQSDVAVSIEVDDATGIAGGDLTLTYNPDMLTAREVKGTTLATGLLVVSNISTPGEVRISFAGDSGLWGGGGSLVEVTFEVCEDVVVGHTSLLSLTVVTLRDETSNPLSLGTISEGTFTVGGVSTFVEGEEGRGLPESFALSQNHPNPFNPITTIQYRLPETGHVKLTVYDLLGKENRVLVSAMQPAGWYHTSWDGNDETGRLVSSGVYFYRLEVEGAFLDTRKMVLVR